MRMVRRYSLLILISPLLLAQALWVKWRTPKLPEPSGPRRGELGEGPKLRLLILGDSAAAGVGVMTQQQALAGQVATRLSCHYRLHWQLEAKSGMTTAQTLAVLERSQLEVDWVLISLGVNDLLSPLGVKRWVFNTETLVETLLQASPNAKILLTPLPPLGHFPRFRQPLAGMLRRREALFNQALRDFCRQHRACELLALQLPLTSDALACDGFHPSAMSYQVWAEAACDQILALHPRR